jgi:hypothetical protein
VSERVVKPVVAVVSKAVGEGSSNPNTKKGEGESEREQKARKFSSRNTTETKRDKETRMKGRDHRWKVQ